MSVGTIVRAEWLKFRSVRATVMGVVITFVLTIGLGALITATLRSHWSTISQVQRLTFDPVSTSLTGIAFAQFAVGVIGTLFITVEYSSGSIRTTLAATPRRAQLVVGKLVVLVVSMAIVSEVVCFITFLMGQAIFAGVVPSASLANASALRAVIFGGIYLTLLSVFGFALGLMFRQSAACISVFTSIVLIIPLIMFALPASWQNAATKYEPSELGRAMSSVTTRPGDFGAGASLAVLVIYVAAALVIGTTLLQRRDA